MKKAIVLTLIIGFLGILAFSILSTKKIDAQKVKQRPKFGSNLPVVELAQESLSQPSERRFRRGSKYDIADKSVGIQGFQLDENSPEELIIYPGPHTPADDAFPVEKSDVILLGRVNSAEAHLSNDRTKLYSEFEVSVTKIFKGDKSLERSSIVVERLGGALRLPSGKIIRRPGYIGKNLPVKGSTYLFFLKSDEVTADFSILTGYEITETEVSPLDQSPDPTKPEAYLSNYDKYVRTTKRDFWRDFRNALYGGRK